MAPASGGEFERNRHGARPGSRRSASFASGENQVIQQLLSISGRCGLSRKRLESERP